MGRALAGRGRRRKKGGGGEGGRGAGLAAKLEIGRMRTPPPIAGAAISMRFTGEPCRDAAGTPGMPGCPAVRKAAMKRLARYIPGWACPCLPRPRLSGRWRTGGMRPRVGGRKMRPCAPIGGESRPWMAARPPPAKNAAGMRPPTGRGMRPAGRSPEAPAPDGGPNMAKARGGAFRSPGLRRKAVRVSHTRAWPATEATTARRRSSTGPSGTGKRPRGR